MSVINFAYDQSTMCTWWNRAALSTLNYLSQFEVEQDPKSNTTNRKFYRFKKDDCKMDCKMMSGGHPTNCHHNRLLLFCVFEKMVDKN